MFSQCRWFRPVIPYFTLACIIVTSLGQSASAIVTAYTFKDLYTLNYPSELGAGTIEFNIHPVALGGLVTATAKTENHGDRAILWNGSGTPIDLTPESFFGAHALAGSLDGQQVGTGYSASTGVHDHALLWNGTNSAIDLNPTGFRVSVAFAVNGGEQVGYGYGITNDHALLWHGTSEAIDLNPPGFTYSNAVGTSGGQQVGFGQRPSEFFHALLWHGTNAAIDLNPAVGFYGSRAYDTDSVQQVGYGDGTNGYDHALLWNGTNAAIDLNPQGFAESWAYSVANGQQVGYGRLSGENYYFPHALLWNGNNAAVDLGALLSGNFQASYAYTLDSAGNVFGLALDNSNIWHSVEWAVVPEPTSLSLMMTCALILRRHRRRRPPLAA